MEMRPDQETLTTLVQNATLAPSSHNTQPWLFRIQERSIELYADPSRALVVNDPNQRELMISCGCALMNLRIGAAHAGWGYRIELFPDTETPDLLARFELQEEELACDLSGLFDAMLLRRTYRNRFTSETPAEALQDTLKEAAHLEGVHLEVLAESVRDELIELVKRGDNLQWDSDAWRKELSQWLHGSRRGDGLTVPGLVAPLVRGVVRHFDMGKSMASQDNLLASESPLLLLLWSKRDAREDWLRVGQALQRVLLEGQRHGMQASYLNQPIQVPALRPELESICQIDGHAQMLLRMGFPEETLPASPRRSLDDVLMEADPG